MDGSHIKRYLLHFFIINYSLFVSYSHCIDSGKLEFVFAFEATAAGNPRQKSDAVRAGNSQQVGGAAKDLVADCSRKAHCVF